MEIIANTKQKLKSDIKEKIGKTKENRVKAKGKTNAAKDFYFSCRLCVLVFIVLL